MKNNSTIYLSISIIVNILILGLGVFLVNKKGGLPYLVRKVALLFKGEPLIKALDKDPYYSDRKSHFKTIPKTTTDVIFLGDSLTACCEWHELFEGKKIINRGIYGDRSDGILNRLDEVLKFQPNKIFLMIGINDLLQGRDVEKVAENYRIILEKIKEKLPTTVVLIQSTLPINTTVVAESA